MPSFTDIFKHYAWDQVSEVIYNKSTRDILQALRKSTRLTAEDFQALISPAAEPFLEEMARKSSMLTMQRFGKTIQMYIPLYLSNECSNICTYCGFSFSNKIPRKTLTDEEILAEAAIIREMGYKHILLVTGEDQQHVGVEYLCRAIRLLRPMFAYISIEVQPLEENEYRMLYQEGVHAVLVYQETYHASAYKTHHPRGKKSNFRYRLETPDRIGRAGIHKIGLGTLIGLEDWRVDSFFTALHLRYLENTYWQTKYSLSFPRLRPFSGGLAPKVEISDRQLVQLITAYRLFSPETELSLSTREAPDLRNRLIPLGITHLSAGSKTDPGGYAGKKENLQQFEISDERTPHQMSEVIRQCGYEPVWKDWDMVIS
jgi:2-iminoacetate synthase